MSRAAIDSIGAGGGAKAEPSPVLSVRGLTVGFDVARGSRGRDSKGRGAPTGPVVRDVSFTLYQGRTLAVVGESGSGKSLTALALMGLLPPGARVIGGTASLDAGAGRPLDLLRLRPAEQRRVRGRDLAMIFQEPMSSLNPVLSIGAQIIETIRLHRGLAGAEAREAAAAALAQVGIADPRRRLSQCPHEFSGGMRQRVMIAMAIACRARVLLADEPTTALDATVQAQILDLLSALRASTGLGVVLITHSLSLVAAHADVVCVMYAGRVVEYAAARELISRPLHPYTRGLLACAPDLGRRGPRLTTVRDVMERDGVSGSSCAGATPWWPGTRPAGVPDFGGERETVLAQVEPNRWVLLWRTAGADESPALPPDVWTSDSRGP